MKKIFVPIYAGLLLISIQLYAQENSAEQIIVPLSSPEKPGVLVIEHIKGSITVNGYDGDVVIVSAAPRQTVKDSKGSTDTDGLKRIASEIIQLSAQEKNNEVIVTTNSHKNSIDLDIKVPYNFSLKLKTYHNGKIVVRNVTGEMEISNINGDIYLSAISGSVVANTIDGNILVEFDGITPDIPMAFTSIEGKIDVTFPPDIKASLKMKSDNGEIFSDFDVRIEKRKSLIDKSDKTGVFKVSLEEWTFGSINGGGPEFLFKTFEGNIYIRELSR